MDFLDFIFPRNSKEFKVFSQEQQRHLGSLTKSTTKYEDVSYSPLSRGLAMQDCHFLWGNTVGYLACSPLWSEGLFSAVTKLANRSHQRKGQKWWLDGSGGLQTLAYLLRGAGTGWLPVVSLSSHDCPAYDPSRGHLLTIPPHTWLVPTYVCPTAKWSRPPRGG